MFNKTEHMLLDGLADNAIVKFTTVVRNVRLLTAQTLLEDVNCIVNDALVHAMPSVQQTLLQFVKAVQLRLMHSLLDVTPYLVIDRIKVGAIRRPQIWRNESRC